IARAEEDFLKSLLNPLWDLRLELGHQVRSLDDLGRLEEHNPEFVVALLDARYVAGDRELWTSSEARLQQSRGQHRQRILTLLLKLIEQRHAKFNNTIYQLEPDVKDSPGALRDLACARWIEPLIDESPRSASPADSEPLIRAERFLFWIRCFLHH